MAPHLKPFYNFQGWRLLALAIVTFFYVAWFIGPGPFGALSGLAPGMPLQEQGYYTGEHAVAVLGQLDASGRKTLYTALICDVPYMILQALLFEALMAFGLKHLKLTHWRWTLVFILPIGFLIADVLEDSFIALTLATGSEVMGTLAGLLTALKFIIFIPAMLISILLFVAGLFALALRRKQSETLTK